MKEKILGWLVNCGKAAFVGTCMTFAYAMMRDIVNDISSDED